MVLLFGFPPPIIFSSCVCFLNITTINVNTIIILLFCQYSNNILVVQPSVLYYLNFAVVSINTTIINIHKIIILFCWFSNIILEVTTYLDSSATFPTLLLMLIKSLFCYFAGFPPTH